MSSQQAAKVTAAAWIVVATYPHREGFASENLERQKYNVYCPKIVKRIRHARRAFDAPRPLFPGYIFVQSGQHWRPLLSTYGVRSVICNGDAPAILPAGFVESLKARESNGVIRKPEAPFKAGQTVTISGGGLDGLVGQIVEIREHDRVLLLLNLLNQQAKVYVNSGMLRFV